MNKPILRKRSVKRVAVLIETTRAYGRRILSGIADYLNENRPWQMFVEPRGLYDPLPDWLEGWEGDGIIARIGDPQVLRKLRKSGIPLVNLKGESLNGKNPPDFCTDRYAVGRMAAEHFLERKFRNFAFVGVSRSSWSELQFQGFSETLAKSGFACEPFLLKLNLASQKSDGLKGEFIDSMVGMLAQQHFPVGILAADDYIGVQLLSACYQADVKVPNMAAVLGVGDEEIICRLTSPALSSVRPDENLLGRKAAALLDALMDGNPDALHHVPEQIPPLDIVTRSSTEVEAVDDPIVMRALGFIRENLGEPINVYDVLNAVQVSRSVLQRRFLKVLGQSVYETILEWKLKNVKEQLIQTNMTMRRIARLNGFRHVEHLNNLFKEKMGVSLLQYRKKYSSE